MINKSIIDNEIKELNKIMITTQNRLARLKSKAPEGCMLRAINHKGSQQFFVRRNKKETNGTYIRKKDRALAKLLAQIEYDQELMLVIEKEISELNALQAIPDNTPYISALEKINPLKRGIIQLPYISDEDYCREWIIQEYPKMDFKEEAPEYYSKKGLRVRSKSEIIIADTLDKYEIPYLYEKPIKLSNNRIVHPDFTLLNIINRKELYWEHFGMMDDIEYRNSAFKKIREYESSGYYQGVNFIYTIETGKLPINTKAVDCMAQELTKLCKSR